MAHIHFGNYNNGVVDIILESNTFNYSSKQVETWAKKQMECNKKIDVSFENQNEEY